MLSNSHIPKEELHASTADCAIIMHELVAAKGQKSIEGIKVPRGQPIKDKEGGRETLTRPEGLK